MVARGGIEPPTRDFQVAYNGRLSRRSRHPVGRGGLTQSSKLSRRVLLGAVTFGALAGRSRGQPTANEVPEAVRTTVDFRMPPDACDCHVHVFCDTNQFPLSSDRPYTPPPATVAALSKMLDSLHIERVVIVSPAVYGSSNDCTLDALRQLGSRSRGIALLASRSSSAECDRLRRDGVRGLRLNFETFGVTDPRVAVERFEWASRLATEQEWHIQINTRLLIVEALEELIFESNVQVVFDHFAQAQASLGVDQPGFAALLRLLRAGRAYVKISAAYRISMQEPHYHRCGATCASAHRGEPNVFSGEVTGRTPMRRNGMDAVPLTSRPPLPVDDVQMLNQLAAWAPDPAIRRVILVENPARLYGFGSSPS